MMPMRLDAVRKAKKPERHEADAAGRGPGRGWKFVKPIRMDAAGKGGGNP
ncbi:hypothetical protein [Thermobacillus sp. ZCTH02-B1]|nr:hypothetical protein [Thermobacillus sp. ZCTH02-B1]